MSNDVKKKKYTCIYRYTLNKIRVCLGHTWIHINEKYDFPMKPYRFTVEYLSSLLKKKFNDP